tara:strand:+ start:12015 stop:13211 length:1197 start_codon:yes stop_codon:yes gene_type:complete
LELIGKKIVIIVENLPLPFDRRVWQESNALKEAGAEVFIICPIGKGYELEYEKINDIHIYRHFLPIEANGAIGYLFEYSYSLFYQRKLLRKIWIEQNGFDVIQACNPPDLIYLNVKKYIKMGVKFVFDHHDINPELYLAKFEKEDVFYKLLKFFERQTFSCADISIATNESYKKIAIERGLMKPTDVYVVRSGPDLSRLKIQAPKIELKKNKLITIGYIGVIGQQEGIDHLLKALKILVDKFNYHDFHCYIIGDGPVRLVMEKMCKKLNLDSFVTFTGRIPDSKMLNILNTCDLCVNPDIYNEMNDKSTMNKIMEYMALGKPIVQYDLTEGRVSAQDASLYAARNDINDFAIKIFELINNKDKRELMSNFGKKRVLKDLHWGIEKEKYLDTYRMLLKS